MVTIMTATLEKRVREIVNEAVEKALTDFAMEICTLLGVLPEEEHESQ